VQESDADGGRKKKGIKKERKNKKSGLYRKGGTKNE